MNTVDAAPTSIPETPGHATAEQVTTKAGRSGAHTLLVACAIAETFVPLAVPFVSDKELQRVADAALTQPADHLLGWQQRVEPGEWGIRWEAARIAVGRLFPNHGLPDVHNVNFVVAPAQRT